MNRVERPSLPFPGSIQRKPGRESDLTPRPRYLAPRYKGSEKLQGKVALITGGDSGIGRSVAVLFAREGADVALVYLPVEEKDARETRDAVENEGRSALLVPGDVTDPGFCRKAVARTIEEFGQLDVLVNNAAFQQHQVSLEDAALKHMEAGAVIVNTGSITGLEGNKPKSLAQNLVTRGIRVNCVAPGPVWTPLNPSDKPAGKVAHFGEDTPMKRPAQPEEIAPAFVFFASEADSSYITGEVLTLLGGETIA